MASGSEAESPVLRERHGRVELVTINRPEARNAIDGATTKALDAAFDDLSADDSVWAVVLTGAGDRAFCAGMDLKAFASGQGSEILSSNGFAGICGRLFEKPLVAAVNGPALAGGFEIVLACDLVVAAEHARFGLPEVKRGLVAAGGGLIRLERLLPRSVAMEMALSGEPIEAARAVELGLVNRLVAGVSVVEEALGLAEEICKNAPLAVRASKEIMRRARDLDEEAAWKMSNELTWPVLSSADALEGALSFAERREPVWRGE